MANGICDSYCKDCAFGQYASGDWMMICTYFLSTGIRRPCPAGEGCTVKQKGRKIHKWCYEDSVQWRKADEYRKRMREERTEQIRRERQIKNLRISTCPECGNVFQTDSPKRIYCGDKCKNRAKSRDQYRRLQEAKAKSKCL